VIVQSLRASLSLPSTISLRQFHSVLSWSTPRLSSMSDHFVLPMALITSVRPFGIERLISVVSLSESKPVASLKKPAASAPPICKVNQIGTCASLSLAGTALHRSFLSGV
jgi:hypothetical protein